MGGSSSTGLSLVAIVSLAVLLLEHCTSVTLARYTQQRVNAPHPAPTVAVLLAELLKLIMSIALELNSFGGMGSSSTVSQLSQSVMGSMLDTARVAVPALLYTVQNNLIYVALANIEVVAFQVLYQTKLLLTALLSFCFLGSRFSVLQWMSLLMLTAGVIAVEMSDASSAGPAKADKPRHDRARGMGAAASLMSALLSSCAGVYFEAVVKRKEQNAPSLWVRNVQLCVFSVPLAAFAVVYQWGHIQKAGGVFIGFDAYANMLVLLNAAGGLVVAVVVKYGDNVLKNFTTSCSVILGTIISVVLFDFKLTLQFVWGAALVLIAAYLYGHAMAHRSAAPQKAAPDANQSLLAKADESGVEVRAPASLPCLLAVPPSVLAARLFVPELSSTLLIRPWPLRSLRIATRRLQRPTTRPPRRGGGRCTPCRLFGVVRGMERPRILRGQARVRARSGRSSVSAVTVRLSLKLQDHLNIKHFLSVVHVYGK